MDRRPAAARRRADREGRLGHARARLKKSARACCSAPGWPRPDERPELIRARRAMERARSDRRQGGPRSDLSCRDQGRTCSSRPHLSESSDHRRVAIVAAASSRPPARRPELVSGGARRRHRHQARAGSAGIRRRIRRRPGLRRDRVRTVGDEPSLTLARSRRRRLDARAHAAGARVMAIAPRHETSKICSSAGCGADGRPPEDRAVSVERRAMIGRSGRSRSTRSARPRGSGAYGICARESARTAGDLPRPVSLATPIGSRAMSAAGISLFAR